MVPPGAGCQPQFLLFQPGQNLWRGAQGGEIGLLNPGQGAAAGGGCGTGGAGEGGKGISGNGPRRRLRGGRSARGGGEIGGDGVSLALFDGGFMLDSRDESLMGFVQQSRVADKGRLFRDMGDGPPEFHCSDGEQQKAKQRK